MARPIAGLFFNYVRDCVRDHLIGLPGQFIAENVALRIVAFRYFYPFIHYLFPFRCVGVTAQKARAASSGAGFGFGWIYLNNFLGLPSSGPFRRLISIAQ